MMAGIELMTQVFWNVHQLLGDMYPRMDLGKMLYVFCPKCKGRSQCYGRAVQKMLAGEDVFSCINCPEDQELPVRHLLWSPWQLLVQWEAAETKEVTVGVRLLAQVLATDTFMVQDAVGCRAVELRPGTEG